MAIRCKSNMISYRRMKADGKTLFAVKTVVKCSMSCYVCTSLLWVTIVLQNAPEFALDKVSGLRCTNVVVACVSQGQTTSLFRVLD